MSKEFFNVNENRDYKLFEELMDDIAPSIDKGQTPTYYYCDATATTSDVIIEYELKHREYSYNEERKVMEKNGKEYKDIIIEAHKLCELLMSMIVYKNHHPKYVNFIVNEDGTKYALCFDIYGLDKMLKKQKFGNIYSKGYEQQEDGWRFLLPIKDAVVFKKGNNDEKYRRI